MIKFNVSDLIAILAGDCRSLAIPMAERWLADPALQGEDRERLQAALAAASTS
jgi:hypothetical protein